LLIMMESISEVFVLQFWLPVIINSSVSNSIRSIVDRQLAWILGSYPF
jgi:hypothetical protein